MNKTHLYTVLFLIIISSISCNQEKEYYKNKNNDLARYKIKGPIKQVKETFYKVENKFGEPTKKYPPLWKEHQYFNYNGYTYRSVRFGDGVTFFLGDDFFEEKEYDDSNRVIKTITCSKIDKVKSANYENDPQGRVWFLEKLTIDTFVYSNNIKSVYKIVNGIPNQHPSWTEKYNNDGKVTERMEFTDLGIPTIRTVYNYNDSIKLISEYVYDSNSIISKTDYDYFPNKKVTTYLDSNYNVGKPLFKTEYFDSTGINIVKVIHDNRGHLLYPTFDEATFEYDRLGNTIKESSHTSSTMPGSIILGSPERKYIYSDYDKFGNWRIKKSLEYDENIGDFVQTEITERIIEPNLELIKQKENESLNNIGLYILAMVSPFLYLLITPLILSAIIILLSVFWGRSKLFSKILVVLSGTASIIFYGFTVAVYYLISFKFTRLSSDWWLSQIIPVAVILLSISIGNSLNKYLKELRLSEDYNSYFIKVRLKYYLYYSGATMGIMTYFLLTYFILLIFNFPVNNYYFNSIREFIINHF